MKPLEILNQKFGYSSFRLEQENIINSVLSGRDTFALMPTGGGKSLCYQIPAIALNGLTLVISPLIALMKDQVDALRVNGIEAAYLNSAQTYKEQNDVIDKARSGRLQLLYVAPERLIRYELFNDEDGEKKVPRLSPTMSLMLKSNVKLIAIDEAHCISQWGHDFRQEYLMLSFLKDALPNIPIIALTATADQLTRKDIIEKLALKDPNIFVSSFNRANIRYTVEPKRDAFDRLIKFLSSRREESGIIYCLSRASTDKLAEDLKACGFDALAYHAGMDRDQRANRQDLFLKDEVKIMVATIAFGMGIDKSNVRYVVHMDLPKNVEGYYQETGRAGRDGLPSEALLFYSVADVIKLKNFVTIDGNAEQSEIAYKKLDQMSRYAELTVCRRKYLLNYFDEEAESSCGNCDVCLTNVEVFDGTVLAQKVMSAIARVGERFGSGYIIDLLRGSRSSKIQPEHRELKTFGAGADVSKERWMEVIQDMIDRGFISKTKGLYPVLTLSNLSAPILNGSSRAMLTKSKHKDESGSGDTGELETPLLTELKDVRRRIAMEEEVPPYIVLSDATLREIATFLPFNKESFRKINGFGEVKIEKYGKAFWEVVGDYCTRHHLKTRIHLKVEKNIKQYRERPERDSDTKRETLRLYEAGHSIDEIAETRELSRSTIEGHLAYYIQQGRFSVLEFLHPDRVAKIEDAIQKAPQKTPQSVRFEFGDEYGYGEIKMVLAHHECAVREHGRTPG